ncbi:carbamoyltransferase family protein [Chitinophaga filiformis]|uniref:Carbamoyltransferase n=1 Tax=Chitinophaga filiformis TaxID=104663 RepID=A0A1G8B7Y9_CHIFI|nr:carbamoyltransferase [Chitinophaga filiformis]SDH29275.1 carbamoyltransferase [Chitinophaga filiformis]
MNILGISALYHDAACCILRDGVLIAAAQEERFSRIKNDPSMPYHAMQYCLKEAGITIDDVSLLSYYELPQKKLSRQLYSGLPDVNDEILKRISPYTVEQEIAIRLGYEGPVCYVPHHLSHAASSFCFSGFNEAAILTMDGVGEWATTTYGTGRGVNIDLFEEVNYPHSVGLLYSTITSYLGFSVNEGEYKVMGLAPYGTPKYLDQFRRLLQSLDEGQFQLDLSYFDFMRQQKMYAPALCELFGQPARVAESPLEQFHKDIAKSLQVFLEELMLEKATYLYNRTGLKNLCLAGGVALNCVANGRILREGPFDALFVQPAANDAGGALGAAAVAYIQETGQPLPEGKLKTACLGPAYSDKEIMNSLKGIFLKASSFRHEPERLVKRVAELIAEGKVIGWFQGRMEFGPRALGSRSILADPRHPEMRNRINAMVKKREGFRPFAPMVLEEKKGDHFELDHASPFMLETCQVKSPLDLPAITHVDGSARVQTVNREVNPLMASLLDAFDALTGCPILLNTSFNVRGEPIVCTPLDAINCFIKTDIDCLVLGNYLFYREENRMDVISQLLELYAQQPSDAISSQLYTFL